MTEKRFTTVRFTKEAFERFKELKGKHSYSDYIMKLGEEAPTPPPSLEGKSLVMWEMHHRLGYSLRQIGALYECSGEWVRQQIMERES